MKLGRNRFAFACWQYFVVRIRFAKVFENVPPIAAAMSGIENGDTREQTSELVWHTADFVRDDIDDQDVQKGCKRIEVLPVMRTFTPGESTRLYTWKERVRVASPPGMPDGFFVGYAATIADAAAWVAMGKHQLYVPWKDTP